VKIQYVAMCDCVRDFRGRTAFFGFLFGEEWVQTVSMLKIQ